MKLCKSFSEASSAALLVCLALLPGCLRHSNPAAAPSAPTEAAAPPKAVEGLLKVDPTETPSAVFLHQGKPFCFTGSNNYYLSYKDKPMVDDVFVQART